MYINLAIPFSVIKLFYQIEMPLRTILVWPDLKKVK